MADPFTSIEVVNRRAVSYEGMFDGIPVVFGPHEQRHFPPHIGFALVSASGLRINLASGLTETYALGITGDTAFPTTPLDGPLSTHNALEVLDRRDVAPLTETEPKALHAHGEQGLGVGKVDKRVTPLPGSESAAVQPASADDVKPVTFINPDVRRGSQRPGRFEGRISNRTA